MIDQAELTIASSSPEVAGNPAASSRHSADLCQRPGQICGAIKGSTCSTHGQGSGGGQLGGADGVGVDPQSVGDAVSGERVGLVPAVTWP